MPGIRHLMPSPDELGSPMTVGNPILLLMPRQLSTGPATARGAQPGGNAGNMTIDQLPPGMLDSTAPALYSSLWAMTVVAAVFLGLRLYCKVAKHTGLWWDDHVLTVSWILLVVNVTCTTVDGSEGLGQHIEVLLLKGADIPPIMELLSLSSFFGILGAVTSKTSFAITLLRLTEGWMKKLVWAIIISMNTIMLADALLVFLACDPPQKTWNTSLPGTCWNPLTFSIFAGSYSGVMDIVLALLPWKITWNLQMRKKEKFGLAFAMSLGVLAGAAAFVKSANISTIQDEDPTFAIPALLIWGAAEIAMTIVAASIPFLRVLLREARSSNGLRTGYRYGYDHPGDNGYAFGSQGGTVLRSKVSITGGRPRTFIRSTTDSSMPSFSQPKAQRSGPRPSKGSPGDDGSDKSILNMPVAEGRIVQTQEVNVEYHQSPFASGKADSSSDAGDSYELGKIASG